MSGYKAGEALLGAAALTCGQSVQLLCHTFTYRTFQVSMAVIVQIGAFVVVTPCSLAGGYRYLEEHAASIFRVEMCRGRNWFSYVGGCKEDDLFS
jgi:predicted lysophospholipase L1 biosynthesis ABC-type transport system permease subunit